MDRFQSRVGLYLCIIISARYDKNKIFLCFSVLLQPYPEATFTNISNIEEKDGISVALRSPTL